MLCFFLSSTCFTIKNCRKKKKPIQKSISREKSEMERTHQCLSGIKKEQTGETVSVAEENLKWNEMKRVKDWSEMK